MCKLAASSIFTYSLSNNRGSLLLLWLKMINLHEPLFAFLCVVNWPYLGCRLVVKQSSISKSSIWALMVWEVLFTSTSWHFIEITDSLWLTHTHVLRLRHLYLSQRCSPEFICAKWNIGCARTFDMEKHIHTHTHTNSVTPRQLPTVLKLQPEKERKEITNSGWTEQLFKWRD